MGGFGSGREKGIPPDFAQDRAVFDIRLLARTARREGICIEDAVWNASRQQGIKIEKTPVIVYTDCTYGGERPWLLCECGRRVGVLYSGESGPRCRTCYGLVYASQYEDFANRQSYALVSRAAKIRWRLMRGQPLDVCLEWMDCLSQIFTDSSLVTGFIPPKPPGMHWATYDRLVKEMLEAQQVGLKGILGRQTERLEAITSRAKNQSG